MSINSKDFVLSSYDYDLPCDRIAQKPTDPRHDAQLMIVPRLGEDLSMVIHSKVWNLLDELRPEDLLVMNNTRVLKARLTVRLRSGDFAELFLLEPYGKGVWLCLGKPAKKMKPGDDLFLDASPQETINLKVIDKDVSTGGRLVQFPECFDDREKIENILDKYGEIPLPPYIQNHADSSFDRYQTRYASQPGAVAAPTAGLHLSDDFLAELNKRGIQTEFITLHVGLGTFRPLEVDDLTDLQLHSEWSEVSSDVVSAVKDCRIRGGRVIAVGTTTVRALESAFIAGKGNLIPFKGKVDLVIKPGFKFGVVDGLLTNFHLPKSSLLLLVSAFIGRQRLLELYRKAIELHYRFYSFGDAMFINPDAVFLNARP